MSALQWAADQADSLASLLADEELRNWHIVRVDESGDPAMCGTTFGVRGAKFRYAT